MKHPLQQLTQTPNEERILLVRRHWILFGRRVGFTFVLALLPLAVWILGGEDLHIEVEEQTLLGALVVMGGSLWYLALCVYFLHAWVDYYLDVWIVSTRRIVNIEQHGLFSRTVSELYLDKVQDVTVEVHGILPTMMHYGDVHIQTAGENPRFMFDDVPLPYKIAEQIMTLHRQFLQANGEPVPQPETTPPPTTSTVS